MNAPSTRFAWPIAIGLSMGPAVSTGLARFAYGLLLPAMRHDLSWTYTQAGWINTANAIGYLMGALLALQFIGTIGARRLYIGGMVLTSLALVASGLTRDFWLLSLWRIVAGIGGAPVFIAGGAMVSTLFRGDALRNSLAIAVYFGGGGFGMLLSGLSIPLIIESTGASTWPVMWLLLGAASLFVTLPAILAARAIQLMPKGHASSSDEPLPIRRMIPAMIGYFFFAVGYIVYLTFLVAWMRTQGASAWLVATTWGVIGAAVMISPFPWKRILARARGGGALALACAMTGIGTLLPLFIPHTIGLLLSAAVFGIAFFIVPSSITTFTRKNLPETDWGRAVALFTTVFAIGQMLGPVAAGFLADATNSLTNGLLAAGITLVLGGVFANLQSSLKSSVV